jgi:hypothetical protein
MFLIQEAAPVPDTDCSQCSDEGPEKVCTHNTIPPSHSWETMVEKVDESAMHAYKN